MDNLRVKKRFVPKIVACSAIGSGRLKRNIKNKLGFLHDVDYTLQYM